MTASGNGREFRASYTQISLLALVFGFTFAPPAWAAEWIRILEEGPGYGIFPKGRTTIPCPPQGQGFTYRFLIRGIANKKTATMYDIFFIDVDDLDDKLMRIKGVPNVNPPIVRGDIVEYKGSFTLRCRPLMDCIPEGAFEGLSLEISVNGGDWVAQIPKHVFRFLDFDEQDRCVELAMEQKPGGHNYYEDETEFCCADAGGGTCGYKIKKSKAKGCDTCPRPGDNIETEAPCETPGDCAKKLKTKIACPGGGPGSCTIKGKRSSCG